MLALTYAPEWLASLEAVPISRRFLLREEPFQGEEVEAYFENLLPDRRETRERLAARSGAASAQPFDLLAAVGRDCVGALQVLPEDHEPEPVGPPRGRRLGEAEIAELLRNLPASPLGVGPDTDFRFSLAGMHDKLPLLWMDESWHLPEGSTPTTHILKPPMGPVGAGTDLSRSPEVEWLSLVACGAFGLPIANTHLARFEDISVLVVERFDREWSMRGRFVRKPVEDLCQALGMREGQKYESQGGPGIRTVLDLFQESDLRDGDRRWFFKSQLVFWLLAAIDGHAKNFSIFLNPRGFRATPLYDVHSADPFFPPAAVHKLKLAMCVGDNRHYAISEIKRRHWIETAKRARFTDLPDVIDEVVYQLPSVLEIIRSRVPPGFPEDLVQRILDGLERRGRILASP